MAALLIVVNISVVNISAVSVAPVVAEEFAEVLITLLLGAGHSQSELDGMNVTQMQSLVTDDVNSGKITIDTPITDPVSGVVMGILEFMNKPENQVARSIVTTAVNDFVGDIISVVDGSVELDERYFVVTSSTIDMQGFGAVIIFPDGDIDYCQYVIRNVDDINGQIIEIGPRKRVSPSGYVSTSNGDVSFGSNTSAWKYYGDIRWSDGTSAPTDDELEYVLGEVDGTKVTPDILNPDGSVTIDGVTYYPADYLDPDALSEEGKNQLINNITNVINNTYVISEDKPIVDEDDITVEVAEEFQDYAVPVGIANIFPFCIPWDIVRGFQLLNRPAITPKFEIPFNIPEFGLFPGIEKSITLDFSEYDKYIQIFRWFQLIGFSFLLCKLSLTRVKGAGA